MNRMFRLLDELLEREGGYVNHPADRGGPTNFGITEATARAHGFKGDMRDLRKSTAAAIYRTDYWIKPRFNLVAAVSETIAAELFDTGVNMGPAVAAAFLQRALNALNRNQRDYPDLIVDGRVGSITVDALRRYFKARGKPQGEKVLMKALDALQGERYIRLAERRPANENFLYGWLRTRIGDAA